ncbi:MAG: hypothetical protein AB7O92_26750 [Acidimicrobiia bacterium]
MRPGGILGLLGVRVDVHRPQTRARMASVLDAVAALGVVLALLGLVAGWIVIGQLDRGTRRSVEVTITSLDSISRTVSVADEVLRNTTGALSSVHDTIAAVEGSFDSTEDLAVGVADLADTLAPALQETSATLRQLERVGADIDRLLGGLSNLPLAPDYRPEAGLGPTFGAIAGDLEPVPEALRATSQQLRAWEASTTDLRDRLGSLRTAVAEVEDDLRASAELVGSYEDTIADARAAAEAARDDLRTNSVVLRVLLVAGALAFALLQLAPWWVGRTLAAETEPPPGTDTAPDPEPERRPDPEPEP